MLTRASRSSFTRRGVLAGSAAALGGAVIGPRDLRAAGGQIVVADYGGDWNDRTVRWFEAPIVEKAGYTLLRDLDSIDERRMKLQSLRRLPRGTLDVAHLDDSTADELGQQGVLEAIDPDKIPNMKDVPVALRAKYLVPWQFSSWVLGYHPEKVSSPPTKYADLWDSKYRGMVGLTDVHWFHHIEMAALVLGQRLDGPLDIPRIKAALLDLKKAVQPRLYANHLPQAQGLKNEESLISTNYKARLVQFGREGVKVRTAFPADGSIGIIYGLALPKKAPNPEGGLFYCNALLDPAGMAGLAQESFYSPANSKAPLPAEARALVDFSEAERAAIQMRPLEFWRQNRAALFEWWNKDFKG